MNTQTQQCHSELTRRLPKYLIDEESQICLKSDKNIGHYTSRRKGALLWLATKIRHKIIYCATLNNVHSDMWFNNVTSYMHCPSCHIARFLLLQEDVRKRTRSDTLYVRTFHSPSHLMWEISSLP